MTKEQFLVQISRIYPDGGYQTFWIVSFIMSAVSLIISYLIANDYNFSEDTTWVKLGKWKLLPLFFLTMAFLSNFVPNKNNFMFIVATPYIVDTGKSLVETLEDKNSKLYKINQIMDKGLDKVLLELENKNNKKEDK